MLQAECIYATYVCVCMGAWRRVFIGNIRVLCQRTDDPHKEVCGPFARLESMNEQNSLPSVDSENNKAVSLIQQVSSTVIMSQGGHTRAERVKVTGRSEHSSVKLHVTLIAIMSAHKSARLTSQNDQLLISSCDVAPLM